PGPRGVPAAVRLGGQRRIVQCVPSSYSCPPFARPTMTRLAAELMQLASRADPNVAPAPTPRRPHVPGNEAIIADRRHEEAREVAKAVMPECEAVVDEHTVAEREVVPDGEAGTGAERSDRGTVESGAHPSAESSDHAAMHAHSTMHTHSTTSTTHARRHRAREYRHAQRGGR